MEHCGAGLCWRLAVWVTGLLLMQVPVHAGPMDIGGQFAINETGAATYSIPIQIPPGTGGIEPKLALSYSSQAGNGLLGVGWSLSGLSSITRCPRTVAQDGIKGGIKFDANDRFCLDGQRLIVVAGVYGANGTEYRTERDSFSKVVSYGVAGSGPVWFKVWTKAGQIFEYGNTADSLIEGQGISSARTWLLNKASDTKGSYFTVTYTEDSANGDFYPSQIDYTGNTAAALAPNASVKFLYETRPDVTPLYFLGSLIKNTQRLKTVQTAVGTTAVREYRLVYQTGAATSRSRITSITECEMTGNTCKPALTPAWSDTAASFSAASSLGALSPTFLADVNGDGRPDFVSIGSDGLYVALANSTGVGPSTKWLSSFGSGQGYGDPNLNPLFMADVNGDGFADAVAFSNLGVYIALSTGSGFSTPVLWQANFGVGVGGWTSMETYPRALVDVNGDGRPDIVGFKTDGVYVALNTGSAFSAPVKWLADFGTTTATAYASSTANPRTLIDINGDGFPDIVGFANAGIYVALGTGTGFSAATQWSSDYSVNAGWTTHDVYPRTFADVNGDGLPDLIGFKADGVYVSINNGRGFLATTQWLADFGTATAVPYATQKGFPRYVADVNGDGKADIVGFSATGVQVALSSGTGFAPASQWVAGFGSAAGYSAASLRLLSDIDGDGFPDVVGVVSNSTTVARSARSIPPDHATGFSSGFGLSTNIIYLPLTDTSVYTRGTGAVYPQVEVASPLFVASNIKNPNALGNGYTTTTYQYGALRSDLAGRGLLGFGWVQATQVEATIASRTYYRQDWPYAGLPLRVMKFVPGSSSYLGLVTNTYACLIPQTGGACAIAAGKRYFPYLSKSIEAGWDTNGAAMPIITTNNTFDPYGNPTLIVSSINDGTSTTATNTYTNDVTNWYLGRLTRSQVAATTGGTPAAASNGLFYFNPVLSGTVNNYNLKTAAIAAGWDQTALLIAKVTVNAGTTLSSTSTSTPAFDTGKDFSPGSLLSLVNNGSIIGRGGNGAGGSSVTLTTFVRGAPGDGGPGLSASAPIQITNSGTIAGGGGGGAGGGGYKINVPRPGSTSIVTAYAGSSGGGGGAGGGTGGAAGVASGEILIVSGVVGAAGTPTAGGAGGGTAVCWQYSTLIANAGGAGGGLGLSGQPGSAVYGTQGTNAAHLFGAVSYPGGAPGAAVRGNINITWMAPGTRVGAVQ